MKLLIQIIFIAGLAFLLESFFPWWTLAIAGFVGGYFFGGKNGRDFLAGFLGAGLLWGIMAFMISSSTGSPLPDRMADIISPALNGTLLILITLVVGGLVGGLSSMTGGQMKRMLTPKRR